jgi:hypothetical protein
VSDQAKELIGYLILLAFVMLVLRFTCTRNQRPPK